MENILFLDDYINLYNKKDATIYVIKPYKGTLQHGRIIDRSKFNLKMSQILKSKKINNNLFNSNILVILNSLITKEDKKVIMDTMDELNYKHQEYLKEDKLLNINKNSLYIFCSDTYFYFLSTNYKGNLDVSLYNYNNVNINNLVNLIKEYHKKDIYLYGKNIKEFITVLEKAKLNYYYFDDASNLLIKLYLNQKENTH